MQGVICKTMMDDSGYICKCGINYKKYADFTRHIKTREDKHLCKLCTYFTPFYYLLTKHYNNKHTDSTPPPDSLMQHEDNPEHKLITNNAHISRIL